VPWFGGALKYASQGIQKRLEIGCAILNILELEYALQFIV